MTRPLHPSPRIHLILLFTFVALLLLGMTRAEANVSRTEGFSAPARIELTDQSLIYGEITDMHDGVVYVTTALMGDVVIPLESIALLESDQEIEVLTRDQNTLSLSALRIVDGELVLEDEGRLGVDQLDVANPEDWEAGRGYHTTGRVTSAVEFSRGNTETDQLNLDMETILESRRDRVTLRADYEETSSIIRSTEDGGVTKTESQATADNWQVIGKYDYFLTDPRNYIGMNLGFTADKFADVKRRSYFGPYYGRKLLSRDGLKLDAELGISYVDTDFLVSEDNDYTGMNINLTGETTFFDGTLKLYFRQINIVNLSSMEKSIYRTTFGLRFPLLLGLEAAAEATADYDGGAAEGKEKLDETLKFRIGYRW
jgi:putative salt-induced outer membrane protein YdiY